MKKQSFLGDDYLLSSSLAKEIYTKYAKDMPIFDYHCHLDPKAIYENKPYLNITRCMLVEDGKGDHYKWRAMRFNGVDEKFITGDASDYQKFEKWAETVPNLIGNPLYLWTHMELYRYFGITSELNKDTCKEIYNKANDILKTLTPRKIISSSNVKCLATTDDPIDSLEYHLKLKEDKTFDVKVLPAFRPDKFINIENDIFNEWVQKLEEVSSIKINNYFDLEKALLSRIDYFNEVGARISDHSIENFLFEDYNLEEIDSIFNKKRNNISLSSSEINKFKSCMLVFLGKSYSKYSWVQQYHIGALRNNNSRMFNILGADTGYDAIDNSISIKSIGKLLNCLESTNELPKTILYSLNQYDNDALLALIGAFGSNVKGKMQLGSAWWFNDHKEGIYKQLKDLSALGTLSNFVGMLTDSRSFLSYTRFDYFRRILSSYVASLIENHEYPLNMDRIEKIIKVISFNNAKEYFGIEF